MPFIRSLKNRRRCSGRVSECVSKIACSTKQMHWSCTQGFVRSPGSNFCRDDALRGCRVARACRRPRRPKHVRAGTPGTGLHQPVPHAVCSVRRRHAVRVRAAGIHKRLFDSGGSGGGYPSFGELVLGCIESEFCNHMFILQHFQVMQEFAPLQSRIWKLLG